MLSFPWNNQIKSASKLFKGFLTLQSLHMSKDTNTLSHSMHTDFLQPSKHHGKTKTISEKAN